jgi:hypothetical protein
VKKIFAIAMICMLMAGFSSAMDAEELIKKNTEAIGGADKIKAVQTMTATGKALVQGMEFPFEMKMARPNLMRLDVTVMGMAMVQAFDGNQGWAINPMAGSTDPQPMGELENKSFKMQSDLDGLLVNYKEKGYTVEYIGEAEVEGTPVYQLHMDTHMDIVIDIFIDQEYFLVIKQSSTINWEEKEIKSDTYMSDFQEVGDGMIVPFSVETRMDETTVSQIVLEKVEYNLDVDESIFVMPAAAPAAAETK